MTAQIAQSAWERLGAMLEQRRVEIDLRYRNLTLFSEERHIDYRLAWDIEHARRTNYRRITLMAVELAYGWEPGSIQRVLTSAGPPLLRDLHRDFPDATGGSGEGRRKNGDD